MESRRKVSGAAKFPKVTLTLTKFEAETVIAALTMLADQQPPTLVTTRDLQVARVLARRFQVELDAQ